MPDDLKSLFRDKYGHAARASKGEVSRGADSRAALDRFGEIERSARRDTGSVNGGGDERVLAGGSSPDDK